MTLHYRLSDPSDLRALGPLIREWEETGNPKAAEWAPAPPRPSLEAVWVSGEWVTSPISSPDWGRFKAALLPQGGGDTGAASALNEALTLALAAVPVACIGLGAALARAEAGDPADFAGCWAAVRLASGMPPSLVSDLASLARDCHLPAPFVAALKGGG